jgi:predicted metal-dependent hydrolase
MQKSVYVESLSSDVILARRKGTRLLRLAIKSDGSIRLSIPYMISEKKALAFIEQKYDWIIRNHKKPVVLTDNAHIGKSHRLFFEKTAQSTITSRLTVNSIRVGLPSLTEWDSSLSQANARKACERALKKESQTLLPQRVEALSLKHGIPFKSIAVKKLKSRWGSCDNQKNIVLNIYLVQLDWILIDYVILHELAHTKYQNHQAEFWRYLESLQKDYKQNRKALKMMPTGIIPTIF